MGSLEVKKIIGNKDKAVYLNLLLNDVAALEELLAQKMFERDVIRVGAEQEFCLVNEDWEPGGGALGLLNEMKNAQFAPELADYNLEANLDPEVLTGSCFSTLQAQLHRLMDLAEGEIRKKGQRIIYTGILPTIGLRHLEPNYMTPLERYGILNDAIVEKRESDIEIHIRGADEINLHHKSILLEGCNTSFQAHLQIDPNDFANTYNWAQAIAAPVLAIGANSPLLMGRELWEETRIALFAQSVDTRASSYLLNERDSRVSFGSDWAKGSVVDYFRDSIARFRCLLTADIQEDSYKDVLDGKTPKLRALNLHNGTVYRWNRPCYGTTNGKPHIRIENRYLPSGPTRQDQMANMMFWTGLMVGRPKEFDNIHKKMHFKDARGNFYNAARYGMASQFHWDGRLVTSQNLILDELLPMAYRGLYRMNVNPEDVEHYLTIIKNRVATHNGAQWMVKSYRKLLKSHRQPDALRLLVAAMYDKQQKGYPVDSWELATGQESVISNKDRTVRDVMSTRTITAQENDNTELVIKMMQWNSIHHLPIVTDQNELKGLLTWTDVQKAQDRPELTQKPLKDLMKTQLVTIPPEASLERARSLMKDKAIRCLPVLKGKKLIGIVTTTDLERLA